MNLSGEDGKKTAILGPIGSGKSTLFYHLNGIFLPQTGRVIVKGREITKKNLDWIRSTVGLVFQNPDDQLFAPTVKDDVSFGPSNLRLPREEVEKRVGESLEIIGMTGFERVPLTI